MRAFWFNIVEILFSVVPINKRQVLFISFKGLINDNPFYIYKKVSTINKIHDLNLKFIWVTSDRSVYNKHLDDVIKVNYQSIKHAFYARTSKIIIDNGAGYKNIIKKSRHLDFLYGVLKRKNQYNISTWHGTPLKKVGINIPNIEFDFTFSTSNCLIAGNKYTQKVFEYSFPYVKDIFLTGTPRNDILITGMYKEESLKRKLSIPEKTKILLYAPTFRDDVNFNSQTHISNWDINKLVLTLKTKFGGNWAIVYRSHQISRMFEDGNVNSKILEYDKIVYDGNVIEDMAQVLSETDVLISDYSGAIFDFSLTSKPIFLYTPDIQNYEKNERGFNVDFQMIPYSKAQNFSDLLIHISEYNAMATNENDFLEYIGHFEDGLASSRVAKIIFQKIGIDCNYD